MLIIGLFYFILYIYINWIQLSGNFDKICVCVYIYIYIYDN